MLIFLKIGFLEITFWDILDILIVGYLLYQLLRLLRGSIAINILAGLALLYGLWWLVAFLQMDALSMILGQFARLGFIALVIVFQPEMRRFLVMIGQTINQRYTEITTSLRGSSEQLSEESQNLVREIIRTLVVLSENETGALIVITSNPELQVFQQTGIALQAKLTSQLLISIFNKESPLHDGAVVIADNQVFSASCVLPVTDSTLQPDNVGTRHRAAVGITENTNSFALIVSEETGSISYANDGILTYNVSLDHIQNVLESELRG